MNMNTSGSCNKGGCRELVVNGKAVAVPESAVALVRRTPRRRRRTMLKESRILLKDIFPPFVNLATRFRGPLSGLRSGVLRGLYLPVMIPAGGGIAEYADELASFLVVIYDGWWSGAILCSSVSDGPVPLSGFSRAPSGDFAGTASRGDGKGDCLVLDVERLLRREGFLISV